MNIREQLREAITVEIIEAFAQMNEGESSEKVIWCNPRNKRSLRLTLFGKWMMDNLQILNTELDINNKIEIDDKTSVLQNLGLILDLEKIMDTPYYLDKHKIVFYDEDMANWFILCDQNLRIFLDTQKS